METPFDVAQAESRSLRWFSRLILFVLIILVLGGILVSVGGCATAKPPCKTASALVAQAQDGSFYYAFSAADLATWMEVVRMEARGECVVPKGDPT